MSKEIKYNTTDSWVKVPLPDKDLSLPKYVGKWVLGKGTGMYFSMLKKPNWFNRIMTNLLLGWIWIDG